MKFNSNFITYLLNEYSLSYSASTQVLNDYDSTAPVISLSLSLSLSLCPWVRVHVRGICRQTSDSVESNQPLIVCVPHRYNGSSSSCSITSSIYVVVVSVVVVDMLPTCPVVVVAPTSVTYAVCITDVESLMLG